MIDVRMFERIGRGVVATEDLAPGQVLERFHTLRIEPDDYRGLRNSVIYQYAFADADGGASLVLGWLSLVNHSSLPNCTVRWLTTEQGEMAELVALQAVRNGQQLTIDYKDVDCFVAVPIEDT